MRNLLVLLPLLVFVAALSAAMPTGAQDKTPDKTFAPAGIWAEDFEKIMSGSVPCPQRWDILWHWSKTGNVAARGQLLYELTWGDTYRPAYAHDPSLRFRDMAILSVYSFDDKEPDMEKLQKLGVDHLRFLQWSNDKRFFACLDKHGYKEACAAMAIEDGLVPSFEDYAKEVDAAIAAGQRPVCNRPEKQPEQ